MSFLVAASPTFTHSISYSVKFKFVTTTTATAAMQFHIPKRKIVPLFEKNFYSFISPPFQVVDQRSIQEETRKRSSWNWSKIAFAVVVFVAVENVKRMIINDHVGSDDDRKVKKCRNSYNYFYLPCCGLLAQKTFVFCKSKYFSAFQAESWLRYSERNAWIISLQFYL